MIKNFRNKIKQKLTYSLLSDEFDINEKIDYSKEPCPEDNASLWSRLTFGWAQRMLMSGYFNGPLEMSDINDLPKEIKVQSSIQLLNNINYNNFNNNNNNYSRCFIQFIQSTKEEKSFLVGIGYCILLLVASFSYTFSQQLLMWVAMRSSLEIKGCLSMKIYEKTLKISSYGVKNYNSGSIMNLLSVDVPMISNFFWIEHMGIFSFSSQMIGLLALLCWVIGWSGLVGFGIMVITFPINTYIGSKISINLKESMGYADKRTNLTSEFINGIRILKLYSWEKFFLDRIEEQRSLQLNYLYKRMVFWIVGEMLKQAVNAIVLVLTFIVYSISNEITLEVAFTTISIFISLRIPLLRLPNSIQTLQSLIPIAKRVEDFLTSSEIQQNNSFSNRDDGEVNLDCNVSIDNGTFNWKDDNSDDDEEDKPYTLNNINFKAPAGKLTIICGVVGSGKTSLVNGLIGEIYRVNGRVNMPNQISFTTQQPFLLSSSLRDNILFGKEMNFQRYKQVIEACCLTPDLLQLAAKDLTEIGERGINLSGGQKQRISLARALYANSDCYILDEPLSAVDPEVGNHLFNKCIQGMMADKTRILVTHQLQFIPSADHIVVVDNGKLIQGTYSELKSKGIDFESIMKKNKLNIDDQHKDNENNKKEKDILLVEDDQNKSLLKVSDSLNVDEIIISDENDLNLIEKSKLLVEEDRNEGSVSFKVYKEYFKHGASMPLFITTCTVYMISQIIYQMSDFWLSTWSQRSIPDKTDKFYISIYILFIVGFIIFLVIRYFMLAHVTFSASKNLHSSLLNSVCFASCQFFDTNPSGRILNRFSKDISDVDLLLFDLFSDVLYCGSTVLVSICIMIYISPLIILPFLLLIGIYYFIQRLYTESSRELKRLESISRSPIFSLLSETCNGLITIRSFKQQNRFISMMQNHLNTNHRLSYYGFSIHRWVAIRLELISSSVVFLAAFFSLFNSNAGFSVLSVTTALGMCSYLNWTVRQMVELEVKMNSVERIESYLNIPKEGNSKKLNFFSEQIQEEEDDEFDLDDGFKLSKKWLTKGEIEFRNVEIKYRSTGEPSLKNFTLKINQKDHIGIVGRTGAGKSTIGNGLFRMVECSKGSILIDGVDISKIGLHELRSSLGIVPQDPFIFSGTIRLNIDPFNIYTDSEIWVALEKVKLKSTISSMPLKLESMIEEGGEGLSFGQKQLLCLSRTILKNPKIILMDEATSGIDYVTSDLIKQTVNNCFKNCTMITIAHRLDTIIDSTKIAVVDKGKLIEYDSPKNLIENQETRFSKLIKNHHNSFKGK
ncbi:hypothetical protein ACTFIV_010347 [Dictyostelium citrinum]